MQVIKRDGSLVPFNIQKIYDAVEKAFLGVQQRNLPEEIKAVINEFFEAEIQARNSYGEDTIDIETIQDNVENILMKSEYSDVAKAYIIYREDHRDKRFIRERSDYIKKYTQSAENAATSSETDANANVAIKNVANLNGEVYKTTNRQIQRYNMQKKLKEMFPQYEKQYVVDLLTHVIYVHDESNFPMAVNYCEAVSLWPFLTEGSNGMDGLQASAPKNLSSFAGQFTNLVFLLSAQCKGAVAFGEFFNVFDYYCVKDFGEDYINRMDEIVSLAPKKTIRQMIYQYFQQIIYGINQPAGNRSYQSPFTNFSYYDSGYWHALFGEMSYPDGSALSWERVSFIQKLFMNWLNNERTKTLLTFPVETMALLSNGKDIIDQEYKAFAAEMYAKGHSFFTYISDNPNALASCCRLRNEILENTFSFTNGLTGVQTGSANVITLNHNRIIQDWAAQEGYSREYLTKHFFEHEESYVKYLEAILERVYCYHTAYKTMLYEIENAGLITASNAGYISMHKLFSTIGDNGVNEAAEFIGLKCNYNEGYKRFCRLITGTISKQNKLHSTKDFLFNQEFVPAEGLSSKNYRWDEADGYWVPKDRVLYNSYFYLADDKKTSVLDKFRLHGREFTELLDGGVGLHCNLTEHLSKEQYLKLIDFAIAQGTTYFTFNIPNSECTNPKCHHIVKTPLDVCPKCGARMRQWTRVIGYLRPVENYDNYRRIEALRRYYAESADE